MISLAQLEIPACMNDCPYGQFWFGLLLGFILGLLVWALLAMLRCSKNCGKVITVEDSTRGNFSITVPAISSFLRKILSEYPNFELHDMRMNETRNGRVMDITLKVVQDTDLLNVRKELRDRIYAELDSKLGIAEEISAINFEAVDFTANDSSGNGTDK